MCDNQLGWKPGNPEDISMTDIPSVRVLFMEDRTATPGRLPALLAKVQSVSFHIEAVPWTSTVMKRVAAERYDVTLLHFGVLDEKSINRIKTLYGHVEWRPIIVVSDDENDEMILTAVRIGADDFLMGKHLDARLLARSLLFAIERTTRSRKRAGFPAYREIRHTAGGIMDRLPMGVILVSAEGRILMINRKAREIAAMKDGFEVKKDGTIHTSRPAETKALFQLIKKTATTDDDALESEFALSLSRPSLKQPLLLLVSPVGGSADGGDRSGGAAIFISDPEDSVEISPTVLSRLYGLTHAESRILNGLCQGLRLETLAEDLAITVNTVRHHLKQIFRKTETKRQSELIKLVLTGPAAIRAEKKPVDVPKAKAAS